MRKALVVGINEYKYMTNLKGAVMDAQNVKKVLEKNSDNSPNFDVKCMINVKNKQDLRSAIKELFSGKNDIELLYFAGHGFAENADGYILTGDIEHGSDGVSMNEILTLAKESTTPNKIIVLDSCQSGKLGINSLLSKDSSLILEGMTILTASREDEYALETIDNQGLFTSLFVEALNGSAADISGNITPGSVYAYIDKALGTWEQRPLFKTNISRFISLRKVSPLIDSNVLRTLNDFFKTPMDHFKLDPSYEFTNNSEVVHEIIKPYSIPENVEKFKKLQKFASVGLVVPVNADHMYFAAMESKSCKLTVLGLHYWKLIANERI